MQLSTLEAVSREIYLAQGWRNHLRRNFVLFIIFLIFFFWGGGHFWSKLLPEKIVFPTKFSLVPPPLWLAVWQNVNTNKSRWHFCSGKTAWNEVAKHVVRARVLALGHGHGRGGRARDTNKGEKMQVDGATIIVSCPDNWILWHAILH